ncbi:MAG: cyclic nucleotide-binding domain-containing protein, partial [Anaerolineales bacterium]
MVDKYTFLRKIPLFAGLPEADLLQLCEDIEEVHLAPGEMLIHEGDMGEHAYVIIAGQIEIYKELEEKTIQLDVQPPGAVIGEMSLIMAAPRSASGRAIDECTLLAISAAQFENLLNTSPTAARVILQTVAQRLQSSSLLMRQNEKMAQLGIFAAGMAHELNNPSAAVQRSAGQLKKAFQQYIDVYHQLLQADGSSTAAQIEMQHLEERIRAQAAQPGEINLLVQRDKEREMEDW